MDEKGGCWEESTHRSCVGGDGGDDEHENEGDDDLQHQRLRVASRRQRRALECRGMQDEAEHERRRDPARALGGHIHRHLVPREVLGERERNGDGGVHVSSGDVAHGVNHGRHHEPKREGNPHMRDHPAPMGVHHDGPAPREHQDECAHQLRPRLLQEGDSRPQGLVPPSCGIAG
jgi:hypothetical protein